MNKKEEKGIESSEGQKIIYRMFLGGLIGFFLGLVVGLIINPPFPGMLHTSADVQGLTMYSWLMFGFIGSVVCSILSLFSIKKRITK